MMTAGTRIGRRYWQEKMEAWRASGLTEEAYCTSTGVQLGMFRHWATRLSRRSKPVGGADVPSTAGAVLEFIPVAITPPVGVPGDESPLGAMGVPTPSGIIEVTIGRATIRISGPVDVVTVRCVLDVLGSA